MLIQICKKNKNINCVFGTQVSKNATRIIKKLSLKIDWKIKKTSSFIGRWNEAVSKIAKEGKKISLALF